MGSNRRTFLTGTGVAATVGLAGCIGDLVGSDDDDVIDMVLNPAEGGVDMSEQYAQFFQYVEDEADITVDYSEAESYTATVAAIENEQAELADISPTGVVAAPDSMDILGMRIQHGAAVYFSTIVTTPDSPVDELSDIEEDHDVHLADQLSVSGGLYPLMMLHEGGLDVGDAPDGSPEDFEVSYSDHDTALNQLFEREDVVAAGTGAFVSSEYLSEDQMSDDFMEHSAEVGNLDTGDEELQLLAVSDPIPRAPIVARSNWDDPVVEEIEEALLEAEEEDLVDEDAEDPLWFTGVEEATIEDYEPIEDAMDTLDLAFEDVADE
ncbi:PhnD/SsuA/transferrin family substrate-binding protein [Halostagnicola bangensis]